MKSKTEGATLSAPETQALSVPETSQALATQQIGGFEFASEDAPKQGVDGVENLGREDFKLPRLVLAQSGTPERKRTEPVYIKGLDEGHFFDNVTGEIYGEGPLTFAVVRILGKRWIEFNKPEDGGGVKNFNIKEGDPETFFTDDGHGGRTKPLATLFFDYIIMLFKKDGGREAITLSLKGTQIPAALKFNNMCKNAKYGAFTISSKADKRDQYTFFNVSLQSVVNPATGKAVSLALADRALLDAMRESYKTVTARQVIKAENDGEVVDGTVVNDENIPF